MSPEQFLRRTVDARSDQFSFCVALYRGLFRERPFVGEQLNAIADAVIHGRVAPRPRDSDVPAWVQKAVMRGLSVAPAERWPSMEALLAALAHDPDARRRRRLRGAGLGAAAIALVVGGTVAATRHQRRICGGAEQELASVWNEGRSQSIRTAFHASGAPFADEAFAEVARALDGFVGAWTAARGDACAATRIRGDQSEELLDLRMECLAEKRAHAQALTDLWTHADGGAVERAAKLSASLSDVAECNDVPALRSPVRLPAVPSARAAVDGLRQQIARITALQEAGRYDQALPQANAAVREATRLGHAPTRAAALWLLGMLQAHTAKPREAEATLVAAAAAAVGGRDDVMAARAWTALLRLDGVDLQKFDDADRWAQFAEALVERLGSDGLRASLLQARSGVEQLRGHLAEGLAFVERAVPLVEKRYGAESVPVADVLDVLGNALFRMNRNAESVTAHQRALAIRMKLQGPLHPDMGITLDAIAAPLQVLGRYDEELADLRRALAISERVHGAISESVALELDNIGLALAMQEKLADSVEYERRAVAVYDKLGLETMNASIALANLGARLSNVHRNDEALTYLQRALALQEKLLGPKHPELGWTLSSIGQLDLDQHHPVDAIATLERALALWTSDAHINPMNRGQTRFNLAKALWQHGEQTRARAEGARARGEIASDTPVPETKKDVAEIDTWLAEHH
jgi:tetratricopeptide (TPR) repeat protein